MSIQLILGPMFSGKTSELIRRILRYRVANKSTLVVKYMGDTRYSNTNVSTHDGITVEAVSCSKLEDVFDTIKGYDVIGIDEGQFYEDICSVTEELANDGKIVIISSLRGTYLRTPFPLISSLISLADTVDNLSAVCSFCGKDASFSLRLSSETDIEVVGGLDKYTACCRVCYNQKYS